MKYLSLIAACALVASACDTTQSNQQSTSDDSKLPPLPHDFHSFAQPEKARVTNVSLDITPDFKTQQIAGTARLAIQRAAGADSIILDDRDLDIKSVTTPKGDSLGFTVG